MAAAINYPSTQKNLASHIKQFNFFLNHLEDIDTVSFISLGIGNTIIQNLFKNKENWLSQLKFNRCVFVNPYISKSKLLEKLCKNKLINFIIGPINKDLTGENIEKLTPISNIETGVIIANKPFWIRLLKLLTFTVDRKCSDEQIKNVTGATDIIRISNHHHNVFKNNDVSDAVMSFIVSGNF